MNNTEASDIIAELQVMFPDWNAWAKALPDVAATARVWMRALMTQDKHDVLDIIDEYTAGKRKTPTSHEYERLIFGIVSAAREIRDKDTQRSTQREQLKSWREQQEDAKRRRSEYKTFRDRGMGWAGKEFDRLVNSIPRPRSQWSKEDLAWYGEQVKEVVKKVEEMR